MLTKRNKDHWATWGHTLYPDIIKIIYTAVVEPTMLYAASVWAPVLCRKYVRQRLDRITRMFALKICKVHRTVSTNAGTILSTILPLDLRARENAELYTYKKGKPIKNLPGRHLEHEISPFDLPHPAARARIPFDSLSTKEDLDVITDNAPQLFTDGSKIEGKVGAPVSYWQGGREVTNAPSKLADYCSVFQAELFAIEKAVELIERRGKNINHFQILSDSKSALQSIENGHCCNPITAGIRRKLETLRERHVTVQFYWIKAHEGLAGNERADELAKKAAIFKKNGASLRCRPGILREVAHQGRHPKCVAVQI